jgi:hypothetical protein
MDGCCEGNDRASTVLNSQKYARVLVHQDGTGWERRKAYGELLSIANYPNRNEEVPNQKGSMFL